MKQFATHSEKETKDLAKKLANKLTGIIALTGELGAGKTIFVQGLAEGLGIKEKIISPTFVLVRQHRLPYNKGFFYHIDLYRLEGEDFINNIGLEDFISDPKNVVVIEWAEKIENLLPKNVISINMQIVDTNTRRITLNSLLY